VGDAGENAWQVMPSTISTELPLLAVPNISEGRAPSVVQAIARAFTAEGVVRLLDVHSDADHHRAVLTLAGAPGGLAPELARGAAATLAQLDVGTDRAAADIGQHPHVGAVDVVPVVYLDPAMRGAACAEALVAAELISRLGVPVLLYGELAGGRTRAQLRRGGIAELARRLRAGELRPDFGPATAHPTAGVTLVAARAPLVAFNLELAPPVDVGQARRIAALIREGGSQGLPGVRALGIALRRPAGIVAQVSTNVERPTEVPLRTVIAAVAAHAAVASAELVGLAPRAALEDFPSDVPLAGFDPARHILENALGFD